MGVIVLDPDGIARGGRKASIDAAVEACERDGKTLIVLNGEVIAEFNEYDDAVSYLGHINPWTQGGCSAKTE